MLLIPAALLLRPAPRGADAAAGAGSRPLDTPVLNLRSALVSPQFLVLGVSAYFFCCAAHSGPIFHVLSYAIACGVPTMAAVSIYSLEGLAGLGGRVLFGVAADRLGVKPILIDGAAHFGHCAISG